MESSLELLRIPSPSGDWECQTTTYTQPVTVGVDIGSKVIGVSTITDKQELFSIVAELRQDIKKLLLERREYRRNRRYRKTRYRKPRFLNRKRRNNWLSPSVQWKVDAHNRLVNLITRILPVTKIVVEIAPFDTHKIVNPDVEGGQYQEGPQKDFWDVREYCLWREGWLKISYVLPKLVILWSLCILKIRTKCEFHI